MVKSDRRIYQPLRVVTDISLLNTLPQPHLINGLIECIKMFLTHDADSFQYVESNFSHIIQGDEFFLNELISRAIRIKAGVISRDEKDHAERSTLNFGHTIGHALEKLSRYSLLHGHAVAYGILVEATISYLLGLLDSDQLTRIKSLLASLGFHGRDLKQYDLAKLIRATKTDKKASSSRGLSAGSRKATHNEMRLHEVNYVLLDKIGRAHIAQQKFIHPVPDHLVKQALEKTIEE